MSDGEEEFPPKVVRLYADMDVADLRPAMVETAEKNYPVDHVEERANVVRAVNYDDGAVQEVVSFPWHRVEAIEYYPAEEAIEGSPFDGTDPFQRCEADE
jgi:hypothetical protein